MSDPASTCDFCKIIAGTLPARTVLETEDSIAFFPLKPAALGHTLVVPRIHVEDIWSLAPGTGARLGEAVLRVGHALRSALQPDGLNVIQSSGVAASQTVFHLHVHLVPRWRNDHIGDLWPPAQPWDQDVQDDVADGVRSACEAVRLPDST